MELLLVRHALPLRVATADGSPADPPLSEEGRDQAQRLARWFESERREALYTSPLRRALETAEPLARVCGLEPRVEPGVALAQRRVALDHLGQRGEVAADHPISSAAHLPPAHLKGRRTTC